MEILRVSSKSNPNKVAGAIAAEVKNSGNAEVEAIGAGAINQAVKAIAIARGFAAVSNIDLVCAPVFKTVIINEEELTGITFLVSNR